MLFVIAGIRGENVHFRSRTCIRACTTRTSAYPRPISQQALDALPASPRASGASHSLFWLVPHLKARLDQRPCLVPASHTRCPASASLWSVLGYPLSQPCPTLAGKRSKLGSSLGWLQYITPSARGIISGAGWGGLCPIWRMVGFRRGF